MTGEMYVSFKECCGDTSVEIKHFGGNHYQRIEQVHTLRQVENLEYDDLPKYIQGIFNLVGGTGH